MAHSYNEEDVKGSFHPVDSGLYNNAEPRTAGRFLHRNVDAVHSERPLAIIVGIESYICPTQMTLDALAHGQKVYVLADGVSSCNPEEVPIALARLRAAGAIVTTSESFMYELMGDASIPEVQGDCGSS
ncbi:hypothetical protein OIDMADRAFT_21722 [Oidiodendron maius Zn]|uniref:Isochorismatase-like domain-containing protein n=1 Tax=Oidiodendron maius (strain Zn) TaxID=913774 RepID=A0A0C3HUT5_OIDMZ|nr:hypothetical protein OIDMADRAFT_21722 [Oidiodendron maius Zn]